MDKITHLVIRFSDTMFGVGNVIAKHNELASRYGAVWFGKIGTPLARSRIDDLNEQINATTPTFLYLVKGSRRKLTAYKANILRLSADYPREKKLIPKYYKDKELLTHMKTWVKISQIKSIEISDMKALRSISSINPITETLALSSAGHFIVREGKIAFS